MEYKYTILVNKENEVPDNFTHFIELKSVSNFEGRNIQIEKETYRAFLRLQYHLEELGIRIELDEAYRSIEDQKQIMDSFIIRYGQEYANKVVAKPGTSEHHTGLAIDIVIDKDDIYVTENKDLIALENENRIIHENLAKFGFILRYPEDKEEITGYPYESWHFRYIGEEIANIIYEKKITLEEYYECLE